MLIEDVFSSTNVRQRRTIDIINWQSADMLFKQLYLKTHPLIDDEIRTKRVGKSLEYRPVEGPINIEQLPAMLASRYVQRYPYSQKDDPGVMYVPMIKRKIKISFFVNFSG